MDESNRLSARRLLIYFNLHMLCSYITYFNPIIIVFESYFIAQDEDVFASKLCNYAPKSPLIPGSFSENHRNMWVLLMSVSDHCLDFLCIITTKVPPRKRPRKKLLTSYRKPGLRPHLWR